MFYLFAHEKELIGQAAVVSNCLLVCIGTVASEQLDELIHTLGLTQALAGMPPLAALLLAVFAAEHVLMLARWLIRATISDVSNVVQDLPQQQNSFRARALRKWKEIRNAVGSTGNMLARDGREANTTSARWSPPPRFRTTTTSAVIGSPVVSQAAQKNGLGMRKVAQRAQVASHVSIG